MFTLLTIFFINASSTPGATASTESFSLQGGKTVNLKTISFSGNEAISSAQLENLARPFLNRPLSESDLYELKQRILLLYQSKGYQNVQMEIPLKQADSSQLMIVIKEGKRS